MSDAKDFPGLGFDPAPGIVPAVDGLLGQVRDAVNRLGQVEQELDSVLKDPAGWRGRSATEFYTVVRRMAANAGVTKGCLFGVQAALSGWSALLAEYQRNGQSLEQQARQARDRLHRAKNSPDLHLDSLSIGMTGGDATGHPDRVQRNLAAKAELEAAGNELDGILRAGRNVKHMHDESAKSSAGEIKRAIKALTGDEWRGGHIYPHPTVVYPGAIPGAPAFMGDPNWDYKMAGDVYFSDGPPQPGHSRVELSGPVVPGNGITVLRFFIPGDQAAFSLLEGDARGFDTTPGAPSRMTLAWDSDTGRVVFDVAPSTTTGLVVDQGKIDAHEVKSGGANDIRLRPNNAGTGFSADITGLNALLPYFAVNEKVGLEFNGPPGSPPHISLKGDDYPNFEAIQYLPNRGAVSHAQDRMYDPQLPLVDPGVAAAPFTGKTRDLEWDGGRQVDPHRYEVDLAPKSLPDRIPVDLREVVTPPKQPADP
ncbi:hypothetical protein ACFRCG_42765 [Embleya sp. NPDC056575]|uniref:hypothetical protein n=1 Tax=unclassified Embleya TaxID=2699296 RepID=UPI0036B13141